MVVATRLRGTAAVQSAWTAVLYVVIAQGVVGYTQYFTDLPILLVLVHMLLASILVVTLTNGLVHLREPTGSATMGELTAYLDGLPVPHAAALRRVVELALQEVPGAVEGRQFTVCRR